MSQNYIRFQIVIQQCIQCCQTKILGAKDSSQTFYYIALIDFHLLFKINQGVKTEELFLFLVQIIRCVPLVLFHSVFPNQQDVPTDNEQQISKNDLTKHKLTLLLFFFTFHCPVAHFTCLVKLPVVFYNLDVLSNNITGISVAVKCFLSEMLAIP